MIFTHLAPVVGALRNLGGTAVFASTTGKFAGSTDTELLVGIRTAIAILIAALWYLIRSRTYGRARTALEVARAAPPISAIEEPITSLVATWTGLISAYRSTRLSCTVAAGTVALFGIVEVIGPGATIGVALHISATCSAR